MICRDCTSILRAVCWGVNYVAWLSTIFCDGAYEISTYEADRNCFEGYLYIKNKTLASGDHIWECESRRCGECSAKITLRGVDIVKQANEHTRAPPTGRLQALKVYKAAIDKAKSSHESTRGVLSDCFVGLAETAVAQLPTTKSLKTNSAA